MIIITTLYTYILKLLEISWCTHLIRKYFYHSLFQIQLPGSPGNRFAESLTLNLSNNSGSLSGRLSSLSGGAGREGGGAGGRSSPGSGGEEEESSSDWDSWDEEEEVGEHYGIELIYPWTTCI